MLSVSVGPKAITLSGIHCIYQKQFFIILLPFLFRGFSMVLGGYST
jgi:hypothetical protein